MIYTGANLEGADFWSGIDAQRAAPGWNWLSEISVLVSPSIVESRPNSALAARRLGVPVFASAACGLAADDGVTIMESPLSLAQYLIKFPQCASPSCLP